VCNSVQQCAELQESVLRAHLDDPSRPPEPPPKCYLVGGFVSEAVYNAQAAVTPTPSEREIVSANIRRAQARLAEARSNQPTLNIGEFECLPDNAGIRVSLTVNMPGRFTVFQNVRVEARGKILFLGTSSNQQTWTWAKWRLYSQNGFRLA
jgi:hypothetical protein